VTLADGTNALFCLTVDATAAAAFVRTQRLSLSRTAHTFLTATPAHCSTALPARLTGTIFERTCLARTHAYADRAPTGRVATAPRSILRRVS